MPLDYADGLSVNNTYSVYDVWVVYVTGRVSNRIWPKLLITFLVIT